MKPHLEQALRDHDERLLEKLLDQLTSPGLYACRRVVLSAVEILMPRLATFTPTLSEDFIRRRAMERAAAADLPADLDEIDGQRQRREFRDFLAWFVAETQPCPTILRPGLLENLPSLRARWPAILEADMRAMAEEAFGEDSTFELYLPEPEPCEAPLVAELSPNCPKPSPSAAALLRRYAEPPAPRSGGCS